MKEFIGIIMAGDLTAKTITIECLDGIWGATLGVEVKITPLPPKKPHVPENMEEFLKEKTKEINRSPNVPYDSKEYKDMLNGN